MTRTTWVRRRRKYLKRAPMPLPRGVVPTNNTANIVDSIRLLWLQGRCDAEIRRILGIDIDQFRAAKESMRNGRVDHESALESFRRYSDEHLRFRVVQEEKLKILSDLYESATRRDPLEDRPYDVRAARRILKDMSDVDVSIRENETLLLSIRVQLGLVSPEKPMPKPFGDGSGSSGDNGSDDRLFSAATVRAAWKKRVENEKVLQARDITGNK